jgi:outer membrane protein assembly factor BamB
VARGVRVLPVWCALVAIGATAAVAGAGMSRRVTPSVRDSVTVRSAAVGTAEWRTFAGSYARRFFNAGESYLTPATAGALRERWRFGADAIITSSPAVAAVDVPGEGVIRVVYFTSWDHHVYAVRLDDGSRLWSVAVEEQPGATFPAAASVDVSTIDGRDVVTVGVGEILYALDAATGAEVWRFTAGTGCRDAQGDPPGNCRPGGERNEIESSVAIVDGLVVFGLDVNDVELGKGGVFGLDASDGSMQWFLDLQTGAVCRPDAGDDVHRFDGYHNEAELGLPAGFFATRAGCDFPRDRTGCQNTWSSPAYDPGRALFFVATSNCDTDTDPGTTRPPPPMPPYDEALVAFRPNGTVAWKWRPREVDNDDLAFGAAPNLFTIRRATGSIDVVGIGNKDGSYTVVDRDGVNEENGVAWDAPGAPTGLPYWSTKVVPGGDIGGIPQTAAVDDAARRVFFTTAPGFDPLDPQHPTVHALNLDTGAVVWQNSETDLVTGDASFGPTSAVPGLVFAGSVITPNLRIYDAATGRLIASYNVGARGGGVAVATGAVVVDGTLLVGTGIGARSGDPTDQSEITSRLPSSLVALCVPGAPGCPTDGVAPAPIVPAPPVGGLARTS